MRSLKKSFNHFHYRAIAHPYLHAFDTRDIYNVPREDKSVAGFGASNYVDRACHSLEPSVSRYHHAEWVLLTST